MANINNFDCAHYINVQALQLMQKSNDLKENAWSLQQEAAETDQRMPDGLEAAIFAMIMSWGKHKYYIINSIISDLSEMIIFYQLFLSRLNFGQYFLILMNRL